MMAPLQPKPYPAIPRPRRGCRPAQWGRQRDLGCGPAIIARKRAATSRSGQAEPLVRYAAPSFPPTRPIHAR